MKITPLVLTAAQRIPALVPYFSDLLPLTSMIVTQGGLVALNCSQPHGVAVGAQIAASVVDALIPNKIVAYQLLSAASAAAISPSYAVAGDVLVTTANSTDLTFSPDLTKFDPWSTFATIAGTGVPLLDTAVQLVAVPTSATFIVRPTFPIGALPGLSGAAVLLERLEQQVVGWQALTAATPTLLTFPTPASVQRSYTVTNPKVGINIRAWGAVDLDHALSHFTRPDDKSPPLPALNQGYLFVVPIERCRISRDRNTRTDATVEFTPQADMRLTLIDGFEIIVILPAENYGGAVGCVDKCQGPIFSAVLQTFNGIRVPRSEIFVNGSDYVAALLQHGCRRYDRANYIHVYEFELIAQLTNQDRIQPNQIPDVSQVDIAIQNGNPLPVSIPPIGSVDISGFDLAGIYRQGQPQPLVCNVKFP